MSDNNKKARVERLYREHFKAGGYQYVDSDDLIFMLSELRRLYFPVDGNVGYTEKCKNITSEEEGYSWK